MKAPETMTAAEINRELDRLDVEDRALCQEFIDAGRGWERPSETRLLSDPLSLRYNTCADRRSDLRYEAELRYGPGFIGRLPIKRGWYGPRVK